MVQGVPATERGRHGLTAPRTSPEADAASLREAQLLAAQASVDEHEAVRRWDLVPGRPHPHGRRATPRWRRRYTIAVVGADLAAAAAVALVAVVATAPTTTGPGELLAAAGLAVAVVGALTVNRAYEHRFVGQGSEEFRRVGLAGTALVAVLSTLAYAAQATSLRGLVLLGAPSAALATLVTHAAARQALHVMRRRGRCQQRALVIGLERSVAELARTLQRDPGSGLRLVAACVPRSSTDLIDGVPVLGTPTQAQEVLRRTAVDTVLLTAWSDVSQEDLRRLSWHLEGTGVQLLVAPRVAEVAVPRLHVHTISGMPLLTVDEPEFTGLRRVAKSGLDCALGLTALVLAAPLMLAVAVAVKITSPGPVLFRQQRIGKDSRPFLMTKFRSMYVDAEDRLAQVAHLNEHGSAPLFKLRQDPRVTPVGRFIRRFSLDELPQLFDVLRRDMSLVGPRPPLPREVATYEDDVRRRLLVKPGMTGLWQVSGRSDLSWEESVRLDLSYVENWSFWLDLSIIARTVTAVLARRGAY